MKRLVAAADHLCRVRACVNPAHLDPVTQAENNQRAWDANGLYSHCRRGHRFTEDNTVLSSNGRSRHCRTCRRLRMRDYMRRVRAVARVAS